MARRPSTTVEAPAETVEALEAVEAVEATETETPTETPEVENVENETGEPAENETGDPIENVATEAGPDLSAFEEAVDSAVVQADESTGVLPEVAYEAPREAFRALDSKGKKAAKAHLETRIRAAMANKDIVAARALFDLDTSLAQAAPKARASREATPVDPTDAFVERIVSLRYALNLVKANPPEGIADDWSDKASALADANIELAQALYAHSVSTDENKGEAPEVPAFVEAGVKLALGKTAKIGAGRRAASAGTPRGTHVGPRRDIARHILEAFEDEPVGSFKLVSAIRTFQSEEYGTDSPSAGAISIRLFPTKGECNIPHIVAALSADGKKGAKKVEEYVLDEAGASTEGDEAGDDETGEGETA